MALSAHQPGSASTPSTLGTHPGAVSALSIGRTGYSVLSMYQYHSKVTDPALDGIKWNDWKIKHGPTPVVANWYPEDSVQCSLKTHSSQSKHQQKCKEPPIATTSCPFGTYQKHQIFSRGVAPNMPKCFHFSSQQLQQQLLTNVRLPRTSRSGVWAPASPRQYNPHAPIQSYWTRLDGPSKLTAVCLMDFSRSPIKMNYVDRKFVSKKNFSALGCAHSPSRVLLLAPAQDFVIAQEGWRSPFPPARCKGLPAPGNMPFPATHFYMAKENR